MIKNKKIKLLLLGGILMCLNPLNAQKTFTIFVEDKVINADYVGNGVEWDPYDEAPDWGTDISEEDWEKLFKRLDFMKPRYVRCMINSAFRYYNPKDGSYNKDRKIESLCKLLDYCTKRNINVVYGEYNPPTWDMKQDQKWIDMSVDYLNYLVNVKNFSCIKNFIIFNEPDGDWASTNGNYKMWEEMLFRFHKKMEEYPGLLDKVKLAGPDVVADYKNNASLYDTEGWIKNCVKNADSIIGAYDIHAYPGQNEVRTGKYLKILLKYKKQIPQGKRILLGEAGYKYWREADSLLMKEYNKRVEGHSYTKGSDCNMLCYDYFYGLDMPLLASEVMNAGYSGLAVWMLDDAMHSSGDSGKVEDVKIWGMWNILGEEVFHNKKEEEIRPLFYTWSLMCRYFPTGTDVLKVVAQDRNSGIFAVAGKYNGKYTIALINVGDNEKSIDLKLPSKMTDADIYLYQENNMKKDADGFPLPQKKGTSIGNKYKTLLPAQSFKLITNIK